MNEHEHISEEMLRVYSNRGGLEPREFLPIIAEVRRLRDRDEQFWTCKSCGAMFRHIPHDDDVSFCSSCIERDILRARVKKLESKNRVLIAVSAHLQAMLLAMEEDNAD